MSLQTHVKKDPSDIKRADKTKRRKRHLKESARLKTPKEGSTKGKKKRERTFVAISRPEPATWPIGIGGAKECALNSCEGGV